MAGRTRFFRWWYLLLVLPVVLYFGAHRYATYRLDRAIDRAGRGAGNALSVADYDFDLIPLGLEVNGIDFRQDREAFTGRGNLRSARVEGVGLFSLLSRDPIRVRGLYLSGLDADITLTEGSGSSNDSSQLSVAFANVALDSIYLTVNRRRGQLAVAHLSLEAEGLRLPGPITVDGLSTRADSLSARRGNTKLVAVSPRLRGLATGSAADSVRLDSLVVSSVRGHYEGARSRVSSSTKGGTAPPRFTLNTLAIREVDVTAGGEFGSAGYDGEITGSDLTYDSVFNAGTVMADAEEVNFDDARQLFIRGKTLHLRSRHIQLPVNDQPPGPTEITLDSLLVQTAENNIASGDIRFDNQSGKLTGNSLTYRGNRVEARVNDVMLEGVDETDFLTDRGPLTAQGATLSHPTLKVNNRDGGRYDMEAEAVTATELQLTGDRHAGRARIVNARIDRYGSNGKQDVDIVGAYLDQYDLASPLRPRDLGETKLSVRRMTLIDTDRPVRYAFDGMRYGSRRREASVDSLRRKNDYSPTELFRREIAKSWLAFGLDSLRLTGIARDPILNSDSVVVGDMRVGDFELSVIENLSLPLQREGRRPFPIEALRRTGLPIIVDSIRLSSTEISYGIVDSLLDPKTIRFTGGTAGIAGLDTREARRDSVRVTFDATFEETTPLFAEFLLARDSSGRNFAMRGRLGGYDLSRVNPLMRVAAEAIVESGRIEELSYDGRLQDEVITGRMQFRYDSLNLKLTGRAAWLKNLLSGMVVKNANPEDGDFRKGELYHEHDASRSFFNAYWKGLVSGLKSSVLADIALKEELD